MDNKNQNLAPPQSLSGMDYLNSISAPQESTPAPEQKGNKKLFLLLGAAVLIVVLLVAIVSVLKSDPIKEYVSPNEFSANYGSTPEEIIHEFSLDPENLDLESKVALSSLTPNSLNYYLDGKNLIVAIYDPEKISARESETEILIVYAAVPKDNDFIGFSPSDFSSDGTQKSDWFFPEELATYFSASELFDQLSAGAKFYLLSK